MAHYSGGADALDAHLPCGASPLGDIWQDSNVLHWLRHHSFPDSAPLGAERHRIKRRAASYRLEPTSGGAVPFRLLRRFDLRWLKVPLSGFLFLGFDPGRGGDSSGTHAPSRPRTRISVTAVAVVHVNGCSTGYSIGRARSCSFSLTSLLIWLTSLSLRRPLAHLGACRAVRCLCVLYHSVLLCPCARCLRLATATRLAPFEARLLSCSLSPFVHARLVLSRQPIFGPRIGYLCAGAATPL